MIKMTEHYRHTQIGYIYREYERVMAHIIIQG
jgi:hypothetical protein